MVFMLPMEFLAPSSVDEEINLSDQIAQFALDPLMAILRNPPIMKGNILRPCSLKAGLMDS